MLEWRILVRLSMMAMVFAGCAWDAGYQKTAGPTLSREGVEVRVIGRECYLNRSADEVVRIDGDPMRGSGRNPTVMDGSQSGLAYASDLFPYPSHPSLAPQPALRRAQPWYHPTA